MIVSVHSLWVYPVKSLAGNQVDEAMLTSKGLLGDRLWMVAKPCGAMLTQRQAPQMACLHATYQDPLSPYSSPIIITDARDNTRIIVPPQNGAQLNVRVHKDTCQGLVAPEITNAWLSQKLNMPVKLVMFDQSKKRETHNSTRFGDNATYFADAAPFLLANKHSIDYLNRQLPYDEQTTLTHFRPNIVIQGLRAFDEHACKTLSLAGESDWELSLIDHCQRCSMITNDPNTGKMNTQSQLFKTLTSVNPMPNNPKAPAFGVNARLQIFNKNEPITLITGLRLSIN